MLDPEMSLYKSDCYTNPFETGWIQFNTIPWMDSKKIAFQQFSYEICSISIFLRKIFFTKTFQKASWVS